MKREKFALVIGTSLGLAMAGVAQATSLYNTNGFSTSQSSPFTLGTIAGQTGGTFNPGIAHTAWQITTGTNNLNASTVNVVGLTDPLTTYPTGGAPSSPSSSGVTILRNSSNGDTYAAPVFNVASLSSTYLDVAFDLNVSNGSSGTTDPIFGIFARSSTTGPNNIIGYTGVDGTTGQVIYSATNGSETASGVSVSLNTWNSYILQLNVVTDYASLYVDGSATPAFTFRFENYATYTGSSSGFSDADLVSLSGNAGDSSTGAASYSNLQIYSASLPVPEPGSLSIGLAGASIGLLRRRKQGKARTV